MNFGFLLESRTVAYTDGKDLQESRDPESAGTVFEHVRLDYLLPSDVAMAIERSHGLSKLIPKDPKHRKRLIIAKTSQRAVKTGVGLVDSPSLATLFTYTRLSKNHLEKLAATFQGDVLCLSFKLLNPKRLKTGGSCVL